jgi:two-component system clock-associated histidine kinase SasA
MPQSGMSSFASFVELIRLSDEIFRLKQEKEELLEQLRIQRPGNGNVGSRLA